MLSLIFAGSSKTKSFTWANDLPPETSPTSIVDSTPYYTDFNPNNVMCDNTPRSISTTYINGYPYLDVNIELKGGINDGFCTEITPSAGVVKKSSKKNAMPLTNFACKIADLSVVYELLYADVCAEFDSLKFKADNAKPDITNGQSCHCPGLGDARFDECPPDSFPEWKSLSEIIYPGNDTYEASFEMCHYLTAHGMSRGCFVKDSWTEVYLKFFAQYKPFPIMKMKPRSIEEVSLVCYISDEAPFNVTLSEMSSKTISIGTVNMTFQLNGETLDKHLFSDYTIVSSGLDFNNVNNLYLINNERVNDVGMYQKDKACSIRISTKGPVFDRATIDQAFIESYQSTSCDPATGKINYPLATFKDLMGPQSSLANKINPSNIYLDPVSSLLKVKSQGSLDLNIKIQAPPGVTYTWNTQLASTTFSDIHFTCNPSINQDGFPCSVTYDYIGEGAFDIISQTANNQVISTKIADASKKTDFILPTIYTSKTQVMLCLKNRGLSSDAPFCQLISLTVKYDRNNDIANSTDNGQDNTQGNGTGNGIFHDADGKLAKWVIGIISAASIIGAIIVLVVFGPWLIVVVKWVVTKSKVLVKKIKPIMEKKTAMMKQDIEKLQSEDTPLSLPTNQKFDTSTINSSQIRTSSPVSFWRDNIPYDSFGNPIFNI